MENKVEYFIDPDKKLIVEYYCGEFLVEELIAHKFDIANNEEYNPNYHVLHDIRDAIFLFSFDEITKYVEFLENDTKCVGKRKSIVLAKTPEQVVVGLGVDMQKRNLPINIKVASTFKTAFKFFKLPLSDINEVETWIENHRYQKVI
ncbi:hypothetical protein ACT3CE_00605 [Marinifilum sp. RC60d5]|uniref:hypothetical protein n=1 Tax=Marinifilum sp. RC60d5 TaxID=3458414 RepID=UPI004035B82B